MAELNELSVGQIVRFKGYGEEMTEPLLEPGELVKIRAINAEGGLIIDMLDASGNVRDDVKETDTLFPEEIEVVDATSIAQHDMALVSDSLPAAVEEVKREMAEHGHDASQVDPTVDAADEGSQEPAAAAAKAPTKAEKAAAAKAAKAAKEAEAAKPAPAENAKGKAGAKGKAAQPAGSATGKAQGGKKISPAQAKAQAVEHLSGKPAETAPETGEEDNQPIQPAGRAAQMGSQGADEVLDDAGPRSELVRAALQQAGLGMGDGSSALAAARSLVDRAEETYYTLGGVLAYIKETGVYKSIGYDGKRGFADYTKAELGTDYRKAQYLIDVYNKVQAGGLDEKRLAKLGWSKAVQIMRVGDVSMDKLSEDFEGLVEYAEQHSRNDLISHINQSYEVARRGTREEGEKVNVSTFVFKLSADAAQSAERALQHAKQQTGSEDLSDAFKYICDDWAMMTEGTSISLEDAMAVMQHRFGVTLQVVANDAAGEEEGEGEREGEQATQAA